MKTPDGLAIEAEGVKQREAAMRNKRVCAMRRLKVMLIGHAYLALENRKNLDELAKFVDLEVVSPNAVSAVIFHYDVDDEVIQGSGWSIRFYRKWVPPRFPQAAYLLRSVDLGLRRFAPDIVHIEADPFSPLFAQVYVLSRIWAPRSAVVCTVKQNTYATRGTLVDTVKDSVCHLFVPSVDCFITVNAGVAELYKARFHADPGRMVPCTHLGVDTKLFAPPSAADRPRHLARFSLHEGAFLVGYCGRFCEDKGIMDLIEAVAMLRERTSVDIRLAMLGMGPLSDELECQARTLGWLQLAGFVPHAEVSCFLKCLDAFVMPSRVLPDHVEHDAHALLEAMAVGLPCVGTCSGAIAEVLPGAGVLVEPGSPAALAQALGGLLDKPERSRQLGLAARRRIEERYSIAAVAETYHRVYHAVVSHAPLPAMAE